MNLRLWTRILTAASVTVLLCILVFALWFWSLYREMSQSFGSDWFLPPLEFYSRAQILEPGMQMNGERLVETLVSGGYQRTTPGQSLRGQNVALWPVDDCQAVVSAPLSSEAKSCVIWRRDAQNLGPRREPGLTLVALSTDQKIVTVLAGEPLVATSTVQLEPQIFAQFYQSQPILRQLVTLGDVPLACLQAITAIEDSKFLDHQGVSVTGLMRALLRNLKAGRVAEGGSTITQQLIKNYFLTSERKFSRKFKELFMALILESKLSKEQILENYLNVIYMGQNGPFQIRGYGAAARHYFNQPIRDLDLPSCSLLAALVNSPGRYSPFTATERAKERRDHVIERMSTLEMITPEQSQVAISSPLPQRPPRVLGEPAPYFVQQVLRELTSLGVATEAGLRVWTSLDLRAQEAAQVAVRKGLKDLDTKKKNLEAALIGVDVTTGQVISLVGGRGFKETQYNRAIQAHRQVGSVMKPFVYLAALESRKSDGTPYHALTLLDDSPLTHKAHGKEWSPQNYDRKFRGPVPLFWALKDSLNVPAVRLAQDVGLQNVIDVARRAGVHSRIEPLPSLALGSFELYPIEVAEAYTTLARSGRKTRLHTIERIERFDGETVFQFEKDSHLAFAPEVIAQLNNFLQQTLISGSGVSIPSWRGFTHPAAGKTGTTSDLRDAWFVGYTPRILALTWVGFDDNATTGLTGAVGAIPMWVDYMKSVAGGYPPLGFELPEGTVTWKLTPDSWSKNISVPSPGPVVETTLVFRDGDQPR